MDVSTEKLLLLARNGNRTAEEKLLSDHSRLIWSVARRYFGHGTDPEDLFQLGCIGFLKAVRGFELSFGTQFSTYAVPKIAGEIRRFLRDDGAIKVSRTIRERAIRIQACRGVLLQRLGREPTVGELSREVGLDAEEIAACETALLPPDSLQRETGEDGLSLEQVLCDSAQEEKLLEITALGEAMEKLTEREQTTLRLRYYRGMTQQAAARVMGLSQVQVSRIEKRAIGNLRTLLS